MKKHALPRPLEQVLFRLLLLRLFLPSLAVILLAIGLTAYLERRDLEYQRLQAARSLARSVENYLDNAGRVLDTAALVAATARTQELAQYLDATQKAFGYFDVLYQLDERGRITTLAPPDPRFPPGFDMSYQPYFQFAQTQTATYISEPFTSFRTGQPTVYMVKPAGKTGLIVGELNLRVLQQAIASGQNVADDYMIFIADRSGRLLAHPQQELVEQQKNISDMEIIQHGRRQETALVYVADNTLMAGNAIPIQRAGWTIVSQTPLAVAYGPFLWSAGLALMLLLALWIIMLWEVGRFSQRIAAPLAHLSQSTQALAAGDYDQGAALAALPAAFAEIRILAANFEQMHQAIQTRQTALQAAEAKNRALLDAIPDLMFLLDKEGVFLDCRVDQGARLLLLPEVFLGKRAQQVLPPEIANLTMQHLAQAFETNAMQIYEYPLTLDGEQRDYEARLVVCGPDQALAIVRDITERKQAEQALRESENRYRGLFEGVPVGLYRTTPEGHILDANPAMVDMLGYPDKESLLAVNAVDLYLSNEDRRRWQAIMEREGIVQHFETQLRRYDGAVIWARDSSRPVQDASGRVFYEGSLEDVTERKHAEQERARLLDQVQGQAQELQAAVARLQELDRLKTEFIQNVSHELRTPLAIIMGYAEMLNSGELGELQADQRGPIAIITRRVQMLKRMVEGLTLILEAEAGQAKQEPVDMVDLVNTLVADFQMAAEKAKISLASHIELDTAVVIGDPVHLRRVLDNLIGNALKFTHADGAVTVSLRRGNAHIVLEVADTGIGIAQDKLARIFDRFYQVDGSSRRRYGGLGLGLTLVKEVIEAHGGQVSVQSAAGHGTTFQITLPAAQVSL